MPKNLYVGNLPYALRNEELGEVFSKFGEVHSAHVIIDRETDRSRGFGFITYKEDGAGTKAIEALHQIELQGRPLVVKEAYNRMKNNRPHNKDRQHDQT